MENNHEKQSINQPNKQTNQTKGENQNKSGRQWKGWLRWAAGTPALTAADAEEIDWQVLDVIRRDDLRVAASCFQAGILLGDASLLTQSETTLVVFFPFELRLPRRHCCRSSSEKTCGGFFSFLLFLFLTCLRVPYIALREWAKDWTRCIDIFFICGLERRFLLYYTMEI